ncbi:7271_t:CDS:2 [Funneliformis geosporum]|nr:7271_t:CDS:2 [Funneliformis geosporum]
MFTNNKNKRITLSVSQKQELCQKKIDNPSISNIKLACYYDVKSNMDDIIQNKAKQFAVRFGEAASGSSLEEINEYREKIVEKLFEYALEDIYNCDETALFWQLELSKTLT